MAGSSTLKDFLAIFLVLSFSLLYWVSAGYMVVNYGFGGNNANQVLLNAKNSTPDNGLTLMSDNSLLPISYLPIITKVYGDILSPSYCDYEYLKDFWGDNLAKDASKICDCESNAYPGRINNSKIEKSVGLFQINMIAHKGFSIEYLKVPENNIKEAVKIYNEKGNWSDWYNCGRIMGIIK